MTKNDISTVLSFMLRELPEVTIGTHMNNTNFLVKNKVFAFIKNDSVVMKLPKEKVKEVLETREASPLVMGKKVMKEWVVISYPNVDACEKDLPLFKASIAFVASKA